jgi:hypothetical protein
MTMPALPPPHGTQIQSLGQVAAYTAANMEHVRTALAPDAGLNIDVHSAGNSVAFAMRLPAKLCAFRVCGCWSKKGTNVWGGKVTGCYWWCRAVPIAYWKQWKGLHSGVVKPPDSFWQEFQLGSDDVPTKIWWVVDSNPCCDEPSSHHNTEPPLCGEGHEHHPACGEDEWQGALYPKYGVGQIVWCSLEYGSGEWRVIDAFDNIIMFRLAETLKGCHASALADILDEDCEDGNCEGSSDTSGSFNNPSESSSSGCQPDNRTLRKTAQIRVYDSIGRVNIDFGQVFRGRVIEEGEAHKGCLGWAKYVASRRRFEVMAYGACECKVCSSSSGSSSSSSASSSGSVEHCCVRVPNKITLNCVTKKLEIQYCEICIEHGCLVKKDCTTPASSSHHGMGDVDLAAVESDVEHIDVSDYLKALLEGSSDAT